MHSAINGGTEDQNGRKVSTGSAPRVSEICSSADSSLRRMSKNSDKTTSRKDSDLSSPKVVIVSPFAKQLLRTSESRHSGFGSGLGSISSGAPSCYSSGAAHGYPTMGSTRLNTFIDETLSADGAAYALQGESSSDEEREIATPWSRTVASLSDSCINGGDNADDLIDNEMAQVVQRGYSSDMSVTDKDSVPSCSRKEFMNFYSPNQKAPRNSMENIEGGKHKVHMDMTFMAIFADCDPKCLTQRHIQMRQRVIKNMFCLDDISSSIKIDVEAEEDDLQGYFSIGTVLPFWCDSWRDLCKVISTNPLFVMFFLLISLYAVVGPDVAVLCFPKELDEPLAIINTVVFFFMMIEIVFLVLGERGYTFSVPFALDFLVLCTFFLETWFFYDGDEEVQTHDTQGTSTSRAARASRLSRITRISRLARVTRVIPRIMYFIKGRKNSPARQFLSRRLHRAFLYLDTDSDGFVSFFDLKCFYMCVIRGCPEMLEHQVAKLIAQADEALLTDPGYCRAQHICTLSFRSFSDLFFGMALGKVLLQYHVRDIEHKKGVWKLTQTLTDSTTLKVCIGILILVVVFNNLSPDIEDYSAEQGLAHLQIAASGHPFDITYLCLQIGMLADEIEILFLSLNGRMYNFDSRCEEGGSIISDPSSHVAAIVSNTHLRNSELLQSCFPSCNATNMGMILVSNRDAIRHETTWAIITTCVILFLLMMFIIIFNRRLASFSKSTLQPLHALADDVMAMSCLDLNRIDLEIEAIKSEELEHLYTAFKSMRNAIRSWSMFVPPALVQRLFSAGIEAKIGVARCNATVLFCDIDGFEKNARGVPPKQVMSVLSTVLGTIAQIIEQKGGTLLEFIGDEVLAVFNTPTALRSHRVAAVGSAIDIHKAVDMLPHLRTIRHQDFPICCRCGIHNANVLAGNIGSNRRMKFGVLGDGINLTARVMNLNSRYRTKTLTTEVVVDSQAIGKKFIFRPVDRVAVKGKKEPTTLYEVLAAVKDDNAEALGKAAEKHCEAFRLYHEKRFGDACTLFDWTAKLVREIRYGRRDEPAWILMQRCLEYMRQPPPQEWDGVERLLVKSFTAHDEGSQRWSCTLSIDEPDSFCEKFSLQDRLSMSLQERISTRTSRQPSESVHHEAEIDSELSIVPPVAKDYRKSSARSKNAVHPTNNGMSSLRDGATTAGSW